MEAEKALERITPEEAGISSRQVKKCIEELMHETTQMHGFMAARHGKVFAECWWKPYGPEQIHCFRWMRKWLTSLKMKSRKEKFVYRN